MEDESSMFFFGVNIKPYRKYTQHVTGSLHISNVALASGASGKLFLKVHNQKFTVATLSTATPQASLDLNFSDGDRVYFYAVGNGHLSILGYALSIQQPASYVSYRNMPPGGLHADSWFYDGDEDSADSVATYRTLSDSYMLDSSEDSMDSNHTQSAPEADNRSTETDENKADSQVDTVYELSSDNERPGVIIEELYPTPGKWGDMMATGSG